MKFSTKLFGYDKNEVDLTLSRMENTISTLETNVQYLKERCDALEKQSRKVLSAPENNNLNNSWQIDKSVVVPIKKILKAEDEGERFV